MNESEQRRILRQRQHEERVRLEEAAWWGHLDALEHGSTIGEHEAPENAADEAEFWWRDFEARDRE